MTFMAIGKYVFLRIIECYMLTMENCQMLLEGSNDVVDWMLPQFQPIKDTSIYFTINKMIQGCVGKVEGVKMSDASGTSICCGSSDDMVINPNLNILSAITHGEWNFRGENRILIYL